MVTHNSISLPPQEPTNWSQALGEGSLIPLFVHSAITSPRVRRIYHHVCCFKKIGTKIVSSYARPHQTFLQARRLQRKSNIPIRFLHEDATKKSSTRKAAVDTIWYNLWIYASAYIFNLNVICVCVYGKGYDTGIRMDKKGGRNIYLEWNHFF